MKHLIGKRLGKLVITEVTGWPEDEKAKRFKYGPHCLKVVCDCGTEKLVPATGFAGLRSCGCSQYDHLKTGPNETIQYFPDRARLNELKPKMYTDL